MATVSDNLMWTLESIKGVPSYMLSSWTAIPAFMLGSLGEMLVQDALPVGSTVNEQRLWLSLSRGIQTLYNFSFWNIYDETDSQIANNAAAIAALNKAKTG